MKTVTFNPETHAILPIDPTKAMLDGHFSVLDIEADDVYLHQYELATACFKAMIAAAPEYPADDIKPMAWYLPDVKMVTTSEVERDRWMSAGHIVISLYPI